MSGSHLSFTMTTFCLRFPYCLCPISLFERKEGLDARPAAK